jgi:hypothetical protein
VTHPDRSTGTDVGLLRRPAPEQDRHRDGGGVVPPERTQLKMASTVATRPTAAIAIDCYLSKVEVDSLTSVTILPVAEKVPAIGS